MLIEFKQWMNICLQSLSVFAHKNYFCRQETRIFYILLKVWFNNYLTDMASAHHTLIWSLSWILDQMFQYSAKLIQTFNFSAAARNMKVLHESRPSLRLRKFNQFIWCIFYNFADACKPDLIHIFDLGHDYGQGVSDIFNNKRLSE